MVAFDLVVVGSGIVGLAHALAGVERGWRVALVERERRPLGASVRNFGMIWPIGQLEGTAMRRALRSRERWLELSERAGFWLSPCGSLLLAHEDDEAHVLQEFAERPSEGHDVTWWSGEKVLQHSSAVNAEGLRGALRSRNECAVDPREAVTKILRWLECERSVVVHTGALARSVEESSGASLRVDLSTGERLDAGRVAVCSGADFETLFPEVYRAAGIKRCKLQMMRTEPQPDGFRLNAHLTTGLSLIHYPTFRRCASFDALERRVLETHATFLQHGIHVMASQNHLGEVLLGDSHEDGFSFEPGERADIERWILDMARRCFRLPSWNVVQRWHGIYARPARHELDLIVSPVPGVVVAGSLGGAGMTTSFAFAEDVFEQQGWS